MGQKQMVEFNSLKKALYTISEEKVRHIIQQVYNEEDRFRTMYTAILEENTVFMDKLIDWGVDIGSAEAGPVFLDLCIRKSHVHAAKLLIQRGIRFQKNTDPCYESAIRAAQFNEAEILELLLASGADINAQKKTPTDTNLNNDAVIDILYFIQESSESRSLLNVARNYKHELNEENLKRYNNIRSLMTDDVGTLTGMDMDKLTTKPLNQVIAFDVLKKTLQALPEKETENLIQNVYGDVDRINFMRTAIIEQDVEFMKRLIHWGVDVTHADNAPLLLETCIKHSRLQAAECLIQAGVRFQKDTDPCYEAIVLAAQSGEVEIMEMLLANGADINAKRNLRIDILIFIKISDESKRLMNTIEKYKHDLNETNLKRYNSLRLKAIF